MRHNSKKIKVQLGRDANKMLVRKLATNFITYGKLTTTEKKAKMLKTYMERLVEKTKEKNEANRNYLLRSLANSRLVDSLFTTVGTAMNKKVGGYVTMQKMYQRESDGALMIKLEWSEPVVKEEPKVKVKKAAVVESAPKEAKKKVAKSK
jgi:large subunit ribosomal protein L17